MYQVNLTFFEDSANGDWGLAPIDSVRDETYGDSFNAFWNGQGIFHDCFEHYFENNHKYFRGDAAHNIAGEVAAMGHNIYYYYELGLNHRYSGYMESWRNAVGVTLGLMHEAVDSASFNFGDRLECLVPGQPRLECAGTLEYAINYHWEQFREIVPRSYLDEEDYNRALDYKCSVNRQKLSRLYTWGYRTASRIAPMTYENTRTLDGFIQYWNEFCVKFDAREMGQQYDGVQLRIYPGKVLDWTGWLITKAGLPVNCRTLLKRQNQLSVYA